MDAMVLRSTPYRLVYAIPLLSNRGESIPRRAPCKTTHLSAFNEATCNVPSGQDPKDETKDVKTHFQITRDNEICPTKSRRNRGANRTSDRNFRIPPRICMCNWRHSRSKQVRYRRYTGEKGDIPYRVPWSKHTGLSWKHNFHAMLVQ